MALEMMHYGVAVSSNKPCAVTLTAKEVLKGEALIGRLWHYTGRTDVKPKMVKEVKFDKEGDTETVEGLAPGTYTLVVHHLGCNKELLEHVSGLLAYLLKVPKANLEHAAPEKPVECKGHELEFTVS